MKQITRSIAAALIAATALGAGIAAAEAQTKKVIRINHAGADDILGTEHQMFAWIFAKYVNQKAPTLDVQALSQQRARPVAPGDRGDAARLRRQHACRRHGRVRQFLPGDDAA